MPPGITKLVGTAYVVPDGKSEFNPALYQFVSKSTLYRLNSLSFTANSTYTKLEILAESMLVCLFFGAPSAATAVAVRNPRNKFFKSILLVL